MGGLCGSLATLSSFVVTPPRIAKAGLPVAGIWHWDIQRDQIAWDDANFRVHGLKPKAGPPNYHYWINAVHPDDRAAAVAATDAALAGAPYALTYRIAAGCSTRWVLARGHMLRDASLAPERMFGTDIDVTRLYEAASTAYEAATELADMLGADDLDPDHYQTLIRQIRDGLATAVPDFSTPFPISR
jgi:PAS domain-containing protein